MLLADSFKSEFDWCELAFQPSVKQPEISVGTALSTVRYPPLAVSRQGGKKVRCQEGQVSRWSGVKKIDGKG